MILLNEKVGENHREEHFNRMRAEENTGSILIVILYVSLEKVLLGSLPEQCSDTEPGFLLKPRRCCLLPGPISGGCVVVTPQCSQMVLESAVGVI